MNKNATMNNRYAIAAQTIKDTVSAVDVGEAIGLEIRHGRCQCPFHNGKDFNCVLYRGSRGYYCHVCKQGGDVLSFVQQYNSMSFKDCIAWFNDTFQLGLNLETKISPSEQRKAEIALKMRKNAIEHDAWVKRMSFNISLTVSDIVRRLEDIRDEKRPRTYGEWDEDFCKAIELLPEARALEEECIINCTEVQHG